MTPTTRYSSRDETRDTVVAKGSGRRGVLDRESTGKVLGQWNYPVGARMTEILHCHCAFVLTDRTLKYKE